MATQPLQKLGRIVTSEIDGDVSEITRKLFKFEESENSKKLLLDTLTSNLSTVVN